MSRMRYLAVAIALAVLASRAKAGFMRSRAGRWLERVTGSVLIALGLRVALSGRHAGL